MRALRAIRLVSAVAMTLGLVVSAAETAPSLERGPVGPSPCRPEVAGGQDGFRYDPSEPTAREVAAADARLRGAERSTAHALPKAVTVDVFAHVLRSKAAGGVPERRIGRQIDVLNRAFAGEESSTAAPSPFRFRLADVDVTVNARWSYMDEGTLAETRAKRALHRGGPTDLNLYIGRSRSGSLGWGTQPTRLGSAPKLDGVVVARHTLPGGSAGHYSAGDAAVHETGHWLGLFHTFAGKCGGIGDLVADTPREARPSYTCPIHRDTCTAPGQDPVHNFMDYSYDSCMNRFTPGQVARMRHAWTNLRAAADGTRFRP
jgi:hypothetical protein